MVGGGGGGGEFLADGVEGFLLALLEAGEFFGDALRDVQFEGLCAGVVCFGGGLQGVDELGGESDGDFAV